MGKLERGRYNLKRKKKKRSYCPSQVARLESCLTHQKAAGLIPGPGQAGAGSQLMLLSHIDVSLSLLLLLKKKKKKSMKMSSGEGFLK